ncbi:homeodomain-interacting protein kinase 2 isoform X2 [Syngnathus scovelli]|uniref:homeodomain-interacting protein kinase 2 isoform X2 n=1 Tax=Syngnathus scovelli TaxID=161590 RepID=UPI00210F829D|nr:homeodomain-interacting protein kinase 2 isoform X2 [Syngnathus scovelli]
MTSANFDGRRVKQGKPPQRPPLTKISVRLDFFSNTNKSNAAWSPPPLPSSAATPSSALSSSTPPHMTQSAFSACSSACSSEVDDQDLAEMEGSIVESKSSFYHILKLLDRGTSSHVFKCKNLNTAKDVALKIHKNYALFENEIEMQEIVSVLDPDKKSIVEFIETFTFKRHPCLVFELLDTNLFSMVLDKKWRTFSPNDIRPVAQQSIGVIHTDLKSDNIMLVNHSATPFRVKLIDFGLAICTVDAPLSYGLALQPMGNRAPEVALGLPFSEAIDMWSLGCVLSFLYLGNYLFLANSNYNMLRSMIEVVGRIPDHLLTASKNTYKYFKRSDRDNDGDHPKWRLMTEREYQDKTGVRPESLPWSFKCLDDLLKLKPEVSEPLELEDRKAFVDLLKCLLQMDPERRITPEEALRHPFLTMSHLSQHQASSSYVTDSVDKMKFCPTSTLEKQEPERRSVSGQPLKSRNWRQRFCGFLGAKRTDAPDGPPSCASAADERPLRRARGEDVTSQSWWRKLLRFFRTDDGGGSEPEPLPPPSRFQSRPGGGPKVPSEKPRWYQNCLFFPMNRIVPEPRRLPLRRGESPVRVQTCRDQDLLQPGPEKLTQSQNARADDDCSPRLNKSTQIDNVPRLGESSPPGADVSSRVGKDPSAPLNCDRRCRVNRDKSSGVQRSSRLKDGSARLTETTGVATPTRGNKSRVQHAAIAAAAAATNKPIRAKNDKRSHKLLPVKHNESSPVKKHGASRAHKPSTPLKTEQSSRVYKLRVKTDQTAPLNKWRVKN